MNDEEFSPWIEYRAGDQRPADDVLVQVKLRGGYQNPELRRARHWYWSITGVDVDIVAYRVKKSLVDTFRDAAGITGHPHAALMAEYAKDAAVNPEPWTLWQVKSGTDTEWARMNGDPIWLRGCDYRRKPAEIPTEVVNGFTVPKGLTEAPTVGTPYFLAAPTTTEWYLIWRWDDVKVDHTTMTRGLVYLIKEHAVAKAKAMCGIDPQWKQL